MGLNRNRLFEFLGDIRHQRWIIGILTALIGTVFILIGNLKNGPGFPLDDAWIHQTYARNLAHYGQWVYIPGEPSGGSTSPLWTMLLSIGFMFGQKTPFLWTSMLSTGMLVGIALICNEILQHFFGDHPIIGMAGSLFLVLDWHLLWSAASGMETLFYCLVCIYIFWILISGKYWGWLGAICGLMVWVRPDGLTMLGPVLFLIVIKILSRKFKFRDGLFFILPLLGLLAVYGLFNFAISGSIFPNTFYAKQLEYVQVLALPLFSRLVRIFLIPLSGAGLLLVPGFVYSIVFAIRKKNGWLMTAILWFMGYGLIYALRLPMTYQHGRYLIPLIPVFYLIGLMGTAFLFLKLARDEKKWRNNLLFTGFVLGLVSLIFVFSGETALIEDINTIDQLMVQPAYWIKENSASSDVIAVHDIGAMGYFGERKIIDLAGLIQPEVIPILRNEKEIMKYLVQSKADYIVIMKDWYPEMDNFGVVEKTFEINAKTTPEIVEIKKIR